jgi:hypothetical protein
LIRDDFVGFLSNLGKILRDYVAAIEGILRIIDLIR